MKEIYVELSKSMSCGGCGKTTTVESPHTCKTCGRMLCGNCGIYCNDHIIFIDGGLNQSQCPNCLLWMFPQEMEIHVCEKSEVKK